MVHWCFQSLLFSIHISEYFSFFFLFLVLFQVTCFCKTQFYSGCCRSGPFLTACLCLFSMWASLRKSHNSAAWLITVSKWENMWSSQEISYNYNNKNYHIKLSLWDEKHRSSEQYIRYLGVKRVYGREQGWRLTNRKCYFLIVGIVLVTYGMTGWN
jgi:hypothetical protein